MEITPQTPAHDLPEFLTPQEICAYLRLGRATVYDLIRRGALPVVRFGRVLRVPRAQLLRFINGNGKEESDDGR